ncbi:flotillin family protein [Lacibacterium aquatile]|uniref:Flotillin family protein n=1 Tax=Lacibacterium aquatile TaxID=1168082 RepID=A0ABW5DQK7_9PROT
MELLITYAVMAAIVLTAILVMGLVLARLYCRADKDRSYVRTGLGGQKVVVDGGSLVLPVFHSLKWVNLQTLRLDVRRDAADAMITRDRMRVDIGVEFYVRVKPDGSSIALAAQTLGDRTNNADQLRVLVEAKFVDALRSVAATMALAELQEQRALFVQSVQTAVARDLELNGLELESVSLTRLDQTDTKYFNPNNAFDAEGLATLTRITEAKRQERNQVVRNTEVAIAQQDLEAKQRTLEIERQKQEAELSQQRDIVNKTAETRAAAALKEAEARRSEEEARISSQQAIAEAEALARKVKEMAALDTDLAIQQRRIENERAAATQDIARKRDIEIADQERATSVANTSRAESEARAEAEKARALAIAASEGVTTAKEVAIAERDREIAIIAARKAAEQDATRVRVAAEAERMAASDRADAIRQEAQAEADAAKLKAAASEVTFAVEAEGQRKLNEARNLLSPQMIDMDLTKERLRIVPLALAEAVKPLEKIGDIRIIDMGGGLPGGSKGDGAATAPADGLLNSLLAYRANAPIVDKLLSEAGFTGGANPVEALLQATGEAPKPTQIVVK